MTLRVLLLLLLTLSPSWAETTVLVLRGGDPQRAPVAIKQRLEAAGASRVEVTRIEDKLRVEVQGDLTMTLIRRAVLGGGVEFREQDEGGAWHTVLSNVHFKSATAKADPQFARWRLDLEATEEGKELLAEVTQRLLGKPMAIFVAGRKVQEPIVQEPITGGKAVIWGLDQQEAQELAEAISLGLPTELVEVTTSP